MFRFVSHSCLIRAGKRSLIRDVGCPSYNLVLFQDCAPLLRHGTKHADVYGLQDVSGIEG